MISYHTYYNAVPALGDKCHANGDFRGTACGKTKAEHLDISTELNKLAATTVLTLREQLKAKLRTLYDDLEIYTTTAQNFQGKESVRKYLHERLAETIILIREYERLLRA